MQDREISTPGKGVFRWASWDGTNGSGWEPVCDQVIVLADVAPEKTKGGIYIPDQANEQMSLSSSTGILVAVGPAAFAYDADRMLKWTGEKPKAGDRVLFTRYAGVECKGADGKLYRIMQDRSVGAVASQEGS